MRFEISVDDNDDLNYQSLALLNESGFKATFFLPIIGLDEGFVQDALGAGMEIGAHTMTHPEFLRKLGPTIQKEEILGSKKYLEGMGLEVTKFAYPGGKYDDATVGIVKESGFEEARTAEILKTSYEDPFRKPGTIHVLNYRKEYRGNGWKHWAYEILDSRPEYFHIWWHSWEVERWAQWVTLRNFLNYAKTILR